MAKDTGQRFAYLVLAELAMIRAVVDGIHDYVIAEAVARSGRPKREIIRELNTKLKVRSRKKLDALLARIDLPDLDIG
jgi:hypothetical protein